LNWSRRRNWTPERRNWTPENGEIGHPKMKLDILAFGAHPDDVELFAGGTIAKLGTMGYATGIVDMTRGELGTRGTPATRAQEARESARILGVRIRRNLDLGDGSVEVSARNRLAVISVLREYRPELVLVHHPDDRHPDHVHTSRLVVEAAHHAGLAKIRTRQERFRPNTVLFYMLPAHVIPNMVVDVSDVSEQRLSAIRAYRSQLYDPTRKEPPTYLSQPDFLDHVESIISYYGTLIGRRKGEGFWYRGIPEVADPVTFVRGQSPNRFR
jgi:N-acetylglucosamine malate deacetylase 1